MAAGKEIKNRIKSVKNTKKITKAMELVAASKMKRAVSKTLDARSYANYSWQILQSMSDKNISNSLFETAGDSNKILVLMITSNKGLCGAYNAQVLRATISHLRENIETDFDFATIGKKGDVAIRRLGKNIVASFDIGETVSLADTSPVCDFIFSKFKSGEYKKIIAIYTDFISALNQKPHIKQILPFEKERAKETLEEMGGNKITDASSVEFLFEPGQAKILEIIIPKITKMQIYHMLLEGSASEQSSRMVAMKNASEAAGEMIDDLTLAFNKARQASITQEISEISAGMASVS